MLVRDIQLQVWIAMSRDECVVGRCEREEAQAWKGFRGAHVAVGAIGVHSAVCVNGATCDSAWCCVCREWVLSEQCDCLYSCVAL